MKKFTKISLIAGTACLVIGTAVLTVAFALDTRLHEEIKRAKNEIAAEVMKESTYHIQPVPQTPPSSFSEDGSEIVFEGIKKMEIEVDGGAVQVVQGAEGPAITVSISDETGRSSCYEEEAGELKVKMQPAGSNRIGEKRQIQVFVPEGYEFQEAEFKVKDGVLDVESVSAGKLDIEVESGVAEFSQVTAEREMEVECESGELNIFVNQAESDFDYTVKAKMGGILLGGQYYGDGKGGEWNSSNGSGRKMKLECDTGMIAVEFKDEE
ncbi:DUF4097 family beta strand repeat-containing protein [Clostridium sp. AM58-1XD]|uniref:DUF4097 family beta strand repeat-containing protein n=1 Tax=Clostridium sp. AM58-1XD TaxID=2292307 RepID=UPI000E4D3963|nr:DUF4097 family beta strand repeat-containing protein [Clostridium sp. AM58-1XD]RGZ00584.1 hypothetical protein DXA13_03785 [Clostridium sp. AM58-1XD]